MKHMKQMLDKALEEAHGAKEYITQALHDKAHKKYAADRMCVLAEEELKHAEEFKNLATRDYEDYKREHSSVSEYDAALYEIRLGDIADAVNAVRREIQLYKSV